VKPSRLGKEREILNLSRGNTPGRENDKHFAFMFAKSAGKVPKTALSTHAILKQLSGKEDGVKLNTLVLVRWTRCGKKRKSRRIRKENWEKRRAILIVVIVGQQSLGGGGRVKRERAARWETNGGRREEGR